MSENENILDKKKIETIVKIHRESILKAQSHMAQILDPHNVLVDVDGKPLKESTDRIKESVIAILKEKSKNPTILSFLGNDDIIDAQDIGSSFIIAYIIGATTVSPLMRIMGGLDISTASDIVYMIFNEIASPSDPNKTLFDQMSARLQIDQRDENGNIILDNDKDNKIRVIISLVLNGLAANELIVKSSKDGLLSVSITPLGIACLTHLSAVDAVLNVLEHSLIQNAGKELKNNVIED